MYIPNKVPATLAEMLAFLLPTVENGLFDSVEYDDGDNPTEIRCFKDGNQLYRFGVNTGGQWTVEAYVDSEKTPWVNRNLQVVSLEYVMRCTGGICLISVSLSSLRACLIIAKTADGKTASFRTQISSSLNVNSYAADLVCYPTCFGDNTALKLFGSGYHIKTNYANDSDRTILARIPVVGAYGSTDAFSTVFIRSITQFFNTGEQIIGGRHYGCIMFFALLDD